VQIVDASLKKLTLNAVLPNYDGTARGQFEQAADEDANNETFTEAIEKFVTVLKSWERRLGEDASLFALRRTRM
jgi:hypothetical protein